MSNTLTDLTAQVEKLLGLLKQVDVYGGGGKGSGGSVMPNSLASVSTQAPGFWGTIGKSMTGMGVMASGVSQMMPDVAQTMAREGGYYTAGVFSGGIMKRGDLERSTRLGLGKFQSFPGASAQVAATLAGRGMVPGRASFTRAVVSSGTANQLLNMDNLTAANAFENFGSGATSSNLLRNFGVMTSNYQTGEELSQNEIFQQLKSRFVMSGKTPTLTGTMDSLRRGNLGDTLRNSGLSGEQQSILSSQFLANAMGVNLDFSDPNSVNKLEGMLKEQGYENPFLSQYKLNSKDDQLMETATQPYLAGIKDATGALIALKDFTNDQLIPSFGQLKATLDMFAGSSTGTGSVAGLLGAGAAGAALYKGISGNVKAAGAAGKAGKPTGKLSVKAGGLAGAAMAIPGIINGVASGDPGLAIASTVGSVVLGILGSIGGSAIAPGAGTLAGGIAGSTAGSYLGEQVYNMFTQKPKGATGGTNNADANSQTSNWTGRFGEPRDGGRTHKGIDVALPVGTPLKAVMDGVVIASASGSGARSYGEYVQIEHEGGKSTLYAHLSVRLVKVGDRVVKGQIIGLSGESGFVTGPHLHFELRVNGTPVNPAQYVNLAYGPGGTNKKQFSSQGNSQTSSSNSSVNTSGISTSASVKDILQSISASSFSGSLGVPGAIASLPEPISGTFKSGVIGSRDSNNYKSKSDNGAAVGDGYEPGGLQNVDYMSKPINLVKKSSSRSGGTSPNVTINLSIAQASEGEAKRFVKMVKEMLEEENVINRMSGK